MARKSEWLRNIDPEIREDVHVLCLEDIAIKHRVNYNTLLSYCVRNNIKRHVRKPRDRRLPKDHFQDVFEAFNRGDSIADLAKRFEVSERSINRALNLIFKPEQDATIEADRVHTSEFKRRLGIYLDEVFNKGVICIKNRDRGEMVLMTAAHYNRLAQKSS